MDERKEEIDNGSSGTGGGNHAYESSGPAEDARHTGGDNTTVRATPTDQQATTPSRSDYTAEGAPAGTAHPGTTRGTTQTPMERPMVEQFQTLSTADETRQHVARGETQRAQTGPDKAARANLGGVAPGDIPRSVQVPHNNSNVHPETIQMSSGVPQGVYTTTYTPTHTGNQSTRTEMGRRPGESLSSISPDQAMMDTIVQRVTDKIEQTFARIDTMVMERDQTIRDDIVTLTQAMQDNQNASSTKSSNDSGGMKIHSNADNYYAQNDFPENKYSNTGPVFYQPPDMNLGRETHMAPGGGYPHDQMNHGDLNGHNTQHDPHKWSVREVRSMEPLTSPQKQLFTAMKGLTRRTISTSMNDFTEWHRYMNTLLQACYHSCLTVAHPGTSSL
jgi:hypothetical protein